MYNLLIGLIEGEVGADRMLEHTSDDIRQYVAPATGVGQTRGLRVDRLINFPTLLMPETGFADTPQIARVGHITNLVKSGRNYTFTFAPNPAIAPIPSEHIETAATALGITDWEFHRTHWAVKDVDLYRVLEERVPSTRPKPKVFRFPTEEAPEHDLVAVMMPFSPSFASVYESLRLGIEAGGCAA